VKIKDLVIKQREFYLTNTTLSYDFRINALKKLKDAIILYEEKLKDALKADLGKSSYEAFLTEIGVTLKEISYLSKNLKKYMKNKKVKTSLVDFPAKSFRSPHPYGVVLVISPWNYPVYLTFAPLVGAIAAGNTVILKPSNYSPNASLVIQDIISQTFSEEFVTTVLGGREENQALLDQKFDYIFFTGSVNVGKVVMEKAAKNLTPISLELGGKSPTIVCKDANIELAARRIAFGKYLNSGQTCVAPDYLFIDNKVKDKFLVEFKKSVLKFYGETPIQNNDYPKIINEKHFGRLLGLIKDQTIFMGGESDKQLLKITPTVLENVNQESPIMQEEIFGPILPVMTFDSLQEPIDYINNNPHPLALYLFTDSRKTEKEVLAKCNFGGGCINDTIMQVASDYLPFGGVGESGMGAYHGKSSFDTFTHYRSIIRKSTIFDLKVRYLPVTKLKEKLAKFFLK
jgi:aldehyde dehydrogenase (NAD+)